MTVKDLDGVVKFSAFQDVVTSWHVCVACSVQETPVQILKKLFFFSMLMIICPLATYFVSKSLLFEGLSLSLCDNPCGWAS